MPDAHLEALSESMHTASGRRLMIAHGRTFCFSWATREEDVVKLISDIRALILNETWIGGGFTSCVNTA